MGRFSCAKRVTLSQHRSGEGFQNSASGAKTRSVWRPFSHVTRYDKSSRLADDYPTLPLPLRDLIKNTRATCRGVVDKATASPTAPRRMTGKYMLDVFGGSGFMTKATNHWDCVAMCSTRRLVPGMT